jgi:hypothetical protein
MYTNQNSKLKKVNFNDNNEESISFNVDDSYDDGNYNDYTDNYTDNINAVTSNKQKMTYDDILESMCMRVQNGNLCMVKENLKNEINNLKNKACKSQNKCYANEKSVNTLNNNSYIYNKYFQKHKQYDQSDDTNIVDDINILKQMLKSGQITPQEYNKEVLIKLIDHRNQKLYLQKVKSKKLLFSNSNINISRRNHQQPVNMNKLFRFVGPGPMPYPPTI